MSWTANSLEQKLRANLRVEAQRLCQLLLAVDLGCPSGSVFSGTYGRLAVERYVRVWLPLLLEAPPHVRGRLIPPVDVALVWLLHRLDVHAYAEDCISMQEGLNEACEWQLLHPGQRQALAFTDGEDAAGRSTKADWDRFTQRMLRSAPSARSAATGSSCTSTAQPAPHPFWPPRPPGATPSGRPTLSAVPSHLRVSGREQELIRRLTAALPQGAWMLHQVVHRGLLGGATQGVVQLAVERYCCHLLLEQRHRHEELLPPADVLLVWWAHKAHSGTYLADMDTVMGSAFDRVPPCLDDPEAARRTAELMEVEFGQPYDLLPPLPTTRKPSMRSCASTATAPPPEPSAPGAGARPPGPGRGLGETASLPSSAAAPELGGAPGAAVGAGSLPGPALLPAATSFAARAARSAALDAESVLRAHVLPPQQLLQEVTCKLAPLLRFFEGPYGNGSGHGGGLGAAPSAPRTPPLTINQLPAGVGSGPLRKAQSATTDPPEAGPQHSSAPTPAARQLAVQHMEAAAAGGLGGAGGGGGGGGAGSTGDLAPLTRSITSPTLMFGAAVQGGAQAAGQLPAHAPAPDAGAGGEPYGAPLGDGGGRDSRVKGGNAARQHFGAGVSAVGAAAPATAPNGAAAAGAAPVGLQPRGSAEWHMPSAFAAVAPPAPPPAGAAGAPGSQVPAPPPAGMPTAPRAAPSGPTGAPGGASPPAAEVRSASSAPSPHPEQQQPPALVVPLCSESLALLQQQQEAFSRASSGVQYGGAGGGGRWASWYGMPPAAEERRSTASGLVGGAGAGMASPHSAYYVPHTGAVRYYLLWMLERELPAAVQAGSMPGVSARIRAVLKGRKTLDEAKAKAVAKALARAVAEKASGFQRFQHLPLRCDHPFWHAVFPGLRDAARGVQDEAAPAGGDGGGGGGAWDVAGACGEPSMCESRSGSVAAAARPPVRPEAPAMALRTRPSEALREVLEGAAWERAVSKACVAQAVIAAARR